MWKICVYYGKLTLILLPLLFVLLLAIPKERINPEERELMAKLVYLEVGTCNPECQRAVASVVLNLLDGGKWGGNIEEVIYCCNVFSVAGLLADCTPSKEAYDAVDYIIKHGRTLPKEVRYFRADYDHPWEGYENYTVIDNVYFGYFTNGNH
jgi:spore germination cell wall hydrolase CwlJ-like protein